MRRGDGDVLRRRRRGELDLEEDRAGDGQVVVDAATQSLDDEKGIGSEGGGPGDIEEAI